MAVVMYRQELQEIPFPKPGFCLIVPRIKEPASLSLGSRWIEHTSPKGNQEAQRAKEKSRAAVLNNAIHDHRK